jgi:hypothetical protein
MFDIINGGAAVANKMVPGIVEPTFGKPTFLNPDADDTLLVEQYVASLDKKLDQTTKDLAKAKIETKNAQDLVEQQAAEFAAEKEAWEKEKDELTSAKEELANQLNLLQMRQAQKATDEFNAYWANKKKQAEEDDSSSAAALIKAEKHIKSLQETNANLCYRLSEMRKDLARLEDEAEQRNEE